jgi:hypothetical protein
LPELIDTDEPSNTLSGSSSNAPNKRARVNNPTTEQSNNSSKVQKVKASTNSTAEGIQKQLQKQNGNNNDKVELESDSDSTIEADYEIDPLYDDLLYNEFIESASYLLGNLTTSGNIINVSK